MRRLLLFLCSIAAFGQAMPFPGPGMAHAVTANPAFVQAQFGVGSGVSTLATGAFASPNTAGNLIWLATWTLDVTCANPVTSVTDDATNTYVQIGSPFASAAACMQTWYAKNIGARTANVVTIHSSTNMSFPRVVVAEASGLSTTSPTDQAPTPNNTVGTSVTSNAFTRSTDNEIIFAAVGSNSDQSSQTAGTGYTIPPTNGCVTNKNVCFEYKVTSSSPSSETASMTLATSNNVIIFVTTWK